MSTIRAHQRRARNPKSDRQVVRTPQRTRRHHEQTCSIEETNASLHLYVRRQGKADFLYLDPPWSYGRQTKNMNHNASPSFHYPVMSNTDLLAFDFGQAASRHAMCAMWAPMSQVPLAIQMMHKNGFRYVTAIVWSKTLASGKAAHCAAPGAVLPEHELLLIGRRQAGVPIAKGRKRIHGVIRAVRTAHSAKPQLFRSELERLFPDNREGEPTRFLELFARKRARGWRAWGNQARGRRLTPKKAA